MQGLRDSCNSLSECLPVLNIQAGTSSGRALDYLLTTAPKGAQSSLIDWHKKTQTEAEMQLKRKKIKKYEQSQQISTFFNPAEPNLGRAVSSAPTFFSA